MRRHFLICLVPLLVGVAPTVPVVAQNPGQHDDADRAPFLNLYVGQYQLTESFFLDITRVGDALYIQATGQSRAQLRPRSRTEFVIVGSSLRLTFGVDPLSEEIDHLIFEQGGLGRRAEKLSESEMAPARAGVTLNSDILARYVGTYEEQPGFAITITLEGGQLMAGMGGQTATPILPKSETEFFYQSSGARVSFEVGGDGQAERLILHQGGSSLRMDRIAE